MHCAIIAVLFFGPWYLRPVGFVSDAVLVFYGASMLLAALRGYGGCEVLAVSNWLLRCDDQVGCIGSRRSTSWNAAWLAESDGGGGRGRWRRSVPRFERRGRLESQADLRSAPALPMTLKAATRGRTLHDLRRAALTHLGEDNVSLPLLMAKSRHKNLHSPRPSGLRGERGAGQEALSGRDRAARRSPRLRGAPGRARTRAPAGSGADRARTRGVTCPTRGWTALVAGAGGVGGLALLHATAGILLHVSIVPLLAAGALGGLGIVSRNPWAIAAAVLLTLAVVAWRTGTTANRTQSSKELDP
jgi:hypothetical protein